MDERFTLAHRLLESVDAETECSAEWDAEIRERIRRYDSGETRGIPGAEVFAEADRILRR